MYDGKSEPNEFVGVDRADAIVQAVRFFGMAEEALKVVEPDPGKIVGVGGRSVIVAVPREARTQSRQSARGPKEGIGGQARERSREDRRGRGREKRAETGVGGGSREATEEVEESRATVKGEIGPVGEFLVGAIERMGLGPFAIEESKEGGYLVCELSGRAAEALGAGDGRAAEALQLLANQAAKRGSDDAPRIVVDAAGDVGRREANLRRLAERASRRAKEGGRSVALDPMNARDRRALHVAVRELDGVVTMSVGEGRYRQVVIVPEGAPEYEEAREAAARIDAEREARS